MQIQREHIARVVVSLAVVSGIVWYGLAQQRAADRQQAEAAVLSDPGQDGSAASTDTPDAAEATAVPTYRDGTYTTVASYDAPNGTDAIKVSVTLRDGIITASDVTPLATNPEAARFQRAFAAGYVSKVVSKEIGTLRLSVVAGASLTTAGFQQALAAIKDQARS